MKESPLSSEKSHQSEEIKNININSTNEVNQILQNNQNFLLICCIEKLTKSLHWQQVSEAGLGPFIILNSKRIQSLNTNETFFMILNRPIEIAWPDIILKLFSQLSFNENNNNNNKSISMRLRCLQHIQIQNNNNNNNNKEMITGPTINISKDGVLKVLSDILVSLDTDIETNNELDNNNNNNNNNKDDEKELVLLLYQINSWNFAILQYYNIINNNNNNNNKEIFTCKDLKEQRRFELVIQSVYCLNHFIKEKNKENKREIQEQEKSFVNILMEIILKWASFMHNSLTSVSTPSFHNNNYNNNISSNNRRGNISKNKLNYNDESIRINELTQEEEEGKKGLLLLTSSSSSSSRLHPSPLNIISLNDNMRKDNNNNSCEFGNINENIQNKEIIREDTNEFPLPFMSVCSETIVEAFLLQQKQKKLYFSQLQKQEEEEEEEEEITNNLVSGEKETMNNNNNISNDSSTFKFIPSLIHRILSSRNDTSSYYYYNYLHQHLLSIKQRDLFPTRKMLDESDILRKRLGETTIVRFYDLDPQQLLSLNEYSSSYSNSSSIFHNNNNNNNNNNHIATGACNNAGHPCYLYITNTDIILASAFDDVNEWESSSSSSPLNNRGIHTNTEDNNNNNSNNNVNRNHIKHMLVIPRVSLMSVQLLNNNTSSNNNDNNNNNNSSGACMLQLQTRSCRRIWFVFQRETTMRVVFNELHSLIKSFAGNRFLLSAQRSWRMMALTLVGGDILPFVNSTFYKYVLQNILVAFAEMEVRRVRHNNNNNNNNNINNSCAEMQKTEDSIAHFEENNNNNNNKQQNSNWWLYSASNEFTRQHIPPRQWRVSNINTSHHYFPTYPAQFIIPNCMSNETLIHSKCLRVRSRIESLSYYYPITGAGIIRTAQPAAVYALCNASSSNDILNLYAQACGMQIRIFDLRSKMRAFGNTFVGGGFSVGRDLRFCALVNIHEVRGAFELICNDIIESNPTFVSVMKASGALATGRYGGGNMNSSSSVINNNNNMNNNSNIIINNNNNNNSLLNNSNNNNNNNINGVSGVVLLPSQLQEKQVMAWLEYIRALLRTSVDVARLVAGVSEEEALPPATSSNINYNYNNLNTGGGNSTISGEMNSFNNNNNNNSDRPIQGSSTVHIWTRAFRAIPFGSGTSSLSLLNNNNIIKNNYNYNFPQLPPPPSYIPLQNRRTARLIVVNCSDGWDRTSQVCALAEILLDPYFRTVEGFITLIEKEFISFGHPCLTRSSTLASHSNCKNGNAEFNDGMEIAEDNNNNNNNNGNNSQNSPILLQFLDAVQQLIHMYPNCFEFTESFILLIVDILHAGIVGNFAVNCERDVKNWGLENQTLSLSQFFAILFATTIPTGLNYSNDILLAQEEEEAEKEKEKEYNNENIANTSSSSPSSSSSSMNNNNNNNNNSNILPLQSFFKACGGGASLGNIGWYNSLLSNSNNNNNNNKSRRLHISHDAMYHSGLLNPHFSLMDNKLLIGPLVDPIGISNIKLWENFFLRYNFWSERRIKLQQFCEQSNSTFYAFAVNSMREVELNSKEIQEEIIKIKKQRNQTLEAKTPQSKTRTNTPISYNTIGNIESTTGRSETSLPSSNTNISMKNKSLNISFGNNNNNNNSYTPPIQSSPCISFPAGGTGKTAGIIINSGGNINKNINKRIMPRAASYGAFSIGNKSSPMKKPQSLHTSSSSRNITNLVETVCGAKNNNNNQNNNNNNNNNREDLTRNRFSSAGSLFEAESTSSPQNSNTNNMNLNINNNNNNNITSDTFRQLQQQRGGAEVSTTRTRGYNTLLDELDQAFNE